MVKFSLCLLCFSVSPCLPVCELLYGSFLFYFGNNVIYASLFALCPFTSMINCPTLFSVTFLCISSPPFSHHVGQPVPQHHCGGSTQLLCVFIIALVGFLFLKKIIVFVNKVTFCWSQWPYQMTDEFRHFAVVVRIEYKFRLFASFILQTSKTDRNLPVTNSRERDTV